MMSSIFDIDSDYDSNSSQICDEPKDKTIYFIREESVSDLMGRAFDLCDADTEVNNKWIKLKELLNLDQIKDQLFVINCFSNNLFNYLVKRKARITGPSDVLTAYTNDSVKSLFRINCIKCNPIINNCMENLFVSIEIKDQKRKLYLIKLIESMSGVYCHRITSMVTHLIIDSIKTKLQRKAFNRGIRVLTEEWVLKCWHESQDKAFKADDQSIVDQFIVPLYKPVMTDKQIVLIEDKKPSNQLVDEEEAIDDLGPNPDDGLNWLDFPDPPISADNETALEGMSSHEMDLIDLCDCESNNSDEKLNAVSDENPLDDGLNWILFEELVEDQTMESVIDQNVNKEIVSKTESTNKRKSFETNEYQNKFEKRSQNQKSWSEKFKEDYSIVWDFTANDGMPSQRPYFRI